MGKNLQTLSKELPEGSVEIQEGWVESVKVPQTNVFIKGKYDLLAKRKDNSYMLIDLKISSPDGDKIEKYKTQLGAYKFALENPASGKALKITKLGLLVFYPDSASFKGSEALISFPPKWFEVPIDEKGFLAFAKQIDELLSGPAPAESKTCRWCQYRHLGDTLAHTETQEEIPF